MTRACATLLTALLASLAFLQLGACSGGEWSVNPPIDLSGPHPSNFSGGGGPASITFRGEPGLDSPPRQ